MDVFTYFMVNYMELRWKIIRCFQYYNPQLENLSAKEFLSSPKVLVDIASTHFRAEFATDMLSKIISQNHELIKPLLLALLEEMSKEKRIVRENRALKDCLRKFASAFVIEMKQMTKGFFLIVERMASLFYLMFCRLLLVR
ncbi:MAG: hypothetical protein HWD59_03060 [Coxiellaceae bacterium]|nr:MAG: hypothetical protein HWD59_03060 [Coxiellaceae bacterium]